MVFPIYPGGTYSVGTTAYGKKSESEPTRISGQHYDQVQFSSHLSEAEKRVRETAGQITRQIRTRPSRQELEALREQVSSGTYQVDAKEIAARMLLMEEQ